MNSVLRLAFVLAACFFSLSPCEGRDLTTVEADLRAAERHYDSSLPKDALIERLVRVKDANLPEKFISEVKSALLVYPRSLLCLLLDAGAGVVLVRGLPTADRALAAAHPVGYDRDATFADCRAVFVPTSKAVFVAWQFKRNGRLEANRGAAAGVRHEFAHAVDYFLGRPSLSGRFIADYRREAAAVVVVDRSLLWYFLQGGDAGPIEAFAQLLAHKYSHFSDHKTRSLVRCLPDCAADLERYFPAK